MRSQDQPTLNFVLYIYYLLLIFLQAITFIYLFIYIEKYIY